MRQPVFVLSCLLLVSACNPNGQRPGLWLSGDVQDTLPGDWSFTDDQPEIHIQVSTPYLVPHSITIWCAQIAGQLYVGARAPETKHWPGWVDEDPRVRLGIADKVYPVRLESITDPAEIARVSAAYARKYALAGDTSGSAEPVSQRYWRVMPRV